MATGVVASDGHRYGRMVGRDRLGSFLNLSMAAGLASRSQAAHLLVPLRKGSCLTGQG